MCVRGVCGGGGWWGGGASYYYFDDDYDYLAHYDCADTCASV